MPGASGPTGPGAPAVKGMAASTVPRRDSGASAEAGGAAGSGAASGRSSATKVPLPVRART